MVCLRSLPEKKYPRPQLQNRLQRMQTVLRAFYLNPQGLPLHHASTETAHRRHSSTRPHRHSGNSGRLHRARRSSPYQRLVFQFFRPPSHPDTLPYIRRPVLLANRQFINPMPSTVYSISLYSLRAGPLKRPTSPQLIISRNNLSVVKSIVAAV